MHDILDFIDELRELKTLYSTGDIREFDFDRLIQKYDRVVSDFEQTIEMDFVKYNPVTEV
jgi:hypothetical protein